jgi:rhodanese-related sulfurtransferase
MIPNENFCRDLKARFNPEKDSLFMICRSGERSTTAAAEAIKCGFIKDRVYNILGGFEGDKIHEEESPFRGKRMVGGWRLEGLPWTYKMKPEIMYLPDIIEVQPR